ncbi:MAG: corrinoid protein [Thermodesulfobacteriota bacterium]
MSVLEGLIETVFKGNIDQTVALTKQGLTEGLDPLVIINQGLIAGMDVVGLKFKSGDMFIPDVIYSSAAMHGGLDVLKPLLTGQAAQSGETIILGTVYGDRHDIGKNLVGMMLEASGFQVVNLGVDVQAEDFVDMAVDKGARIIGMSALLTTTMPAMQEAIEILLEDGIRDKFKVIVGGAPVTQKFADDIGADGYAPDAASAVELCRRLMAG